MKPWVVALLCQICVIFAVSGVNWSRYAYRVRPFYSQRTRSERIGPGKDVVPADIQRSQSFGSNVCVKRIAVGFQTKCFIIDRKYNCSMTSQYRSLFHCCPGFRTILGQSGCPYELYNSNLSLIETAKKLGLNSLLSLIEMAGLTETLSSANKFTLFAPSEKAFKALSQEVTVSLTKDKKALAKILLYHVVNGKLPSSTFEEGQLLETMNSKIKARINKYYSDQLMTVDGARIVLPNVGASNGIIHVIDSVLIPPESRVMQLLQDNKNISLFRKALLMSNIKIADGHTIFAPTNKAFNNIDADLFERLLKSPKCLKNLLLNHILPNTVYSNVISDEGEMFGVRTREGSTYFMSLTNHTEMLAGAKILRRDVKAKDAVLHVIDKVLLPTSALTVLEIAKQNGAVMFTRLIKEVGLKPMLSGDKQFTLFAPSDEAMKEYIGNSSAAALENISNLIKYHIVPESVQACDFVDDMLLGTLDGDRKIRINVYNFGKLHSAQGVCLRKSKCRARACNGAVNILPKVMIASTKSLQDVVNTDNRFTAFAAALRKAGLDSKLNGTRSLTVFAPTNAAFSKMAPAELDSLLADPIRLSDQLKYHMVSGSLFRCAIDNTCPVSTLNGRTVLLKNAKSRGLEVNAALSTQKEIIATNGIIYPIDSVLKSSNKDMNFFRRFWKVVL